MKQDSAETLATDAFVWIAADAERLEMFLGATGVDPVTLRERLADRGFLVAVLDFLLQSDELVLGFAAAQGIAPAQVLRARAGLGGPGGMEWA